MIKGVIFDLDGVITDTAKFHYIAWNNLASKMGIELTEEFNEKLKGIPRIESLKLILEYGNAIHIYSEEEMHEMADIKNEEYKKLLKNLDKKDILPGIEDFINKLKEKNIKIGLASASKNAPMILEKLGLGKKIDYIADPDAVKNGKPAPDIFIEATRGINLNIDDVIGIEDADAGVEAMRSCNMRSIGINVDADLRLESTRELSLDIIAILDNK
ncbi:beta-phosphoglucomutase [Peptostreptococcus faecalis]|uniref:beta-phosphoglucomutase n=1 Tax=Peptostreptococcus faecalis TaxID=2045015 RepID=UPI000C7AA62A|nr:beta-phosphoglucomutase [Peptostreptococcus faecalis]